MANKKKKKGKGIPTTKKTTKIVSISKGRTDWGRYMGIMGIVILVLCLFFLIICHCSESVKLIHVGGKTIKFIDISGKICYFLFNM